jgi:DNA-binding SARP family transcriptional activator
VANLQVSALGRLQVRQDDESLNLGNPQQQAMFVVLLMRAGRSATAADLVEALWGADEPASAMTTLRTYAWRLRKALEKDSKNPSILVSLGDGYRLVLDNNDVDFVVAEELAHKSERAREANDFEGAYTLLESALALWQGEPLAAIPGPFAARQRDRLTEMRLSLQEKRMEVGLVLGHGSRFISELLGLIDQYPLRERLYALLMQAQHQSGRRADALVSYRNVRQLLVDELGVEPGPELASLHQRLLTGDAELVDAPISDAADRPQPSGPALSALPATDGAPAGQARPAFRPPAQLPPQPADFTGRSHLAVTLCSAMNVPNRAVLPVVVLVGMGGVGKSALALHVAHRVRDAYPDGQLYAHLRAGDGEPLRPEGILVGFLSALGHNPDTIPKSLDALTALFRTTLDRRRILIVLDDAKDADQVRTLLPGAADCGVLITSRSRLNGLSPGMQAELQAFLPVEAMELLARTIGAERVERERAAALELMESCAYLPLAVRIVAARLAARPQWTVQSLARRLADERTRVSQLRAGDMTISAAFDVSYRQLTDDQSAALRRTAGIDSPDLSLACATALLGIEEPDAEDLLESLVDAAMLESPSAGKYRFHSLLRGFARDKASPQEQSDAVSRLLDHLFASSMAAFAQFVSGDPIEDALSPTKVPGAHLVTADAARAWAKAEGDCALALVGQIARTVLAGPPPGTQEDESRRQLRICVDLLIALSAFWADTRGSEWVGVVRRTLRGSAGPGPHTFPLREHRTGDESAQPGRGAGGTRGGAGPPDG